MKYLLYLTIFLVTYQNIQAQTQNRSRTQAEKQQVIKEIHLSELVGKLIWEEDFNREKWKYTVVGDTNGYLLDPNTTLPEGWKFIDSTENNFFWHWSDVGPRGKYTSLKEIFPNNDLIKHLPESTSTANGFMLFESDLFNTDSYGEMINPPLEMHSYIEFGPFDFSNHSNIIFNSKIIDRFCCNIMSHGIFLEISSDYIPNETAGRWTSIITREWKDGDTRRFNEQDYYLNVSEYVANETSVYFRINYKNTSHYYAIIDDLRFYEGPENNLQLNDAWVDYLNLPNSEEIFTGGYTSLPKDAVGSFKQFRPVIENNGSNEAENTKVDIKVYRDENHIETFTSENRNFAPFEQDTFIISTDFTPSEIGLYQVSMTVSADFVDEYPKNNSWGYEFETTEHTFSRCRHGKEREFGAASTRDCVGGGSDGDMLLTQYNIPEGKNVLFSGIQVYIPYTTDTSSLAMINDGKFQMKAVAYSDPETEEDYRDLVKLDLNSDLYTLTADDLGKWIYLSFNTVGSLLQNSGKYYVGIESHSGQDPEDNSIEYIRFNIGSDENGLKQPASHNLIYQSLSKSFHHVYSNFAIDLLINMPEMTKVTFNVDMNNSARATELNFDAEKENVVVTGNFAHWDEPGTGKSLLLSDTDGDLIYTGSTYVEQGELFYKYAINLGGWSGEEWSGDPNRTVTVNSDEHILDTVVFGQKPDVKKVENPLNKIKLYPNPFSQVLTISNLENVKEIRITNALGQQEKVFSEFQESITISDLNSGIYFITITDNSNAPITKRVVKY